MKSKIILLAVLIMVPFVSSSYTFTKKEMKSIAIQAASNFFSYKLYEWNRPNGIDCDSTFNNQYKITLLEDLTKNKKFRLATDSIVVPNEYNDSLCIFRIELSNVDNEINEYPCLRYPDDTLIIAVDMSGKTYYLHGFDDNDFSILITKFYKNGIDLSNVTEIGYLYLITVLGYKENEIITRDNFSEMKSKYNMFITQKNEYSIEIGAPNKSISYYLSNGESIFCCCFYSIERLLIYGRSINKRTLKFSKYGLKSSTLYCPSAIWTNG